MKCGYFHTPYIKEKRTGRDVFDWSLKLAKVTDQAGFADFMIGEHYTLGVENIPFPEVIIGAAAAVTENIRFAPMAHLLPYHDPATLAIRIGWLSQVLEGRYFLGVAPGGYLSDAVLHGIEDVSELRPRMLEALDIMEKVWAREPFSYQGEYFKAGFPEAKHMLWEDMAIADNSPYGGRENLEVAVTGLSAPSASMTFAGENNYSPISFFGGAEQIRSHWNSWSEAMEKNGRTADRSRFRVCREIFIADTDKEAKKRALEGGLGESYRNYLLPIYNKFGLLQGIVEDSGTGIDPDDVDMDFVAEHVWICGSPETVVEKLQKMYEDTGGFGEVVLQSHDNIDNPEPHFESLQRLTAEVAPKIKM